MSDFGHVPESAVTIPESFLTRWISSQFQDITLLFFFSGRRRYADQEDFNAEIKEILRLKHQAELSNQQIARTCGVSKWVVNKYLHLAVAKGVTWDSASEADEAEIEQLLFPTEPKPTRLIEPDFFKIHQSLKKKGAHSSSCGPSKQPFMAC